MFSRMISTFGSEQLHSEDDAGRTQFFPQKSYVYSLDMARFVAGGDAFSTKRKKGESDAVGSDSKKNDSKSQLRCLHMHLRTHSLRFARTQTHMHHTPADVHAHTCVCASCLCTQMHNIRTANAGKIHGWEKVQSSVQVHQPDEMTCVYVYVYLSVCLCV